MTTSSRKSYNYLALRGNSVDDTEFVETFGFDPDVAYSDKINEAMMDRQYEEDLSRGKTTAEANAKRKETRKYINSLLANRGML